MIISFTKMCLRQYFVVFRHSNTKIQIDGFVFSSFMLSSDQKSCQQNVSAHKRVPEKENVAF